MVQNQQWKQIIQVCQSLCLVCSFMFPSQTGHPPHRKAQPNNVLKDIVNMLYFIANVNLIIEGETMIETIRHWLSQALRITQNLFFSFQMALDTLGASYTERLFTCIAESWRKLQVFFFFFLKDFSPGLEDMSPDIISPERVMSLHFF